MSERFQENDALVRSALEIGESLVVDALMRRHRNPYNLDMDRVPEMLNQDMLRHADPTAVFVDWGGSILEADGLPSAQRPFYEDVIRLRQRGTI